MTKITIFIFGLCFLFHTAHASSEVELKNLVKCNQDAEIVVDSDGYKDRCLLKSGVFLEPKCQQMSKEEIGNFVAQFFGPNQLSKYNLNNVIEYLHQRSFRMTRRFWEGRDICFFGLTREQLQSVVSNN